MKSIWKLGTLACLSLWACQPAEQVSPPQPVPSASPQPSPPQPSPSSAPSGTPEPTPIPSASPEPPAPSPIPVPEPTPSPESSPTPAASVEPLRFGEIEVIAGNGNSGTPQNGLRTENIPLPDFVSGLVNDVQDNIWIVNSGEGIMGYITPLITLTSSTQTNEYRLYWERIHDLQKPSSILYAKDTQLFYLVETYRNRVISLDPQTGEITPIAGTGEGGYNGDGNALERQLNLPEGLARDASGNLYVADTGNHLIRKITPSGEMKTIAGQYVLDTRIKEEGDLPSLTPLGETLGDGGLALQARLNSPRHLAVTPDGSILYVAGDFQTIRVVSNGLIDRLAGSGNAGFNGVSVPVHQAHMNNPTALTIGPDGLLYFIDSLNLRIRRIIKSHPFDLVETVAGNGRDQEYATARENPLDAEMRPVAMTFDAAGDLWIYDQTHYRLRRLKSLATKADTHLTE